MSGNTILDVYSYMRLLYIVSDFEPGTGVYVVKVGPEPDYNDVVTCGPVPRKCSPIQHSLCYPKNSKTCCSIHSVQDEVTMCKRVRARWSLVTRRKKIKCSTWSHLRQLENNQSPTGLLCFPSGAVLYVVAPSTDPAAPVLIGLNTACGTGKLSRDLPTVPLPQ